MSAPLATRLRDEATLCRDEGRNHTAFLLDLAATALAQPAEPVARVRVHKTEGNAGLAWSAVPVEDAPLMRDGDPLYAAPQPPATVASLSRDAVKVICAEAGYPTTNVQARADFINGIRHGERACAEEWGLTLDKRGGAA